MSQTQIPAGSALARKAFGVALFARTISAPGFAKNLTGEAPQQAAAEAKLKLQTVADMPFVRVTDLSKSQGDAVSVDLIDTVTGKPIMGDRNAEGMGDQLATSSMDIKIDLTTKVVDAGGKMAQQRTVHKLRGLAMAQLAGYFPRLKDQLSIVHLAGSRGTMTGKDWVVPVSTDVDYGDIMINPVLAPTYNRHYVVDTSSAGNLVQGGQQLGAIDSTDLWTLDHVDALSVLLDDMDFPIQPVKFPDDPAANDDPIKGILFLTPRQWNQLKTNASGAINNWRTMLQNAWARKTYGTKHPLFSGEPGMWNGILIRQMPRWSVRHMPGDSTNIITAANQYTATESAQVVNGALTAGFAVDRALLVGAQALADVYGKNAASGYYFSWHERPYNFERALEVAGDAMGGMSKLRFKLKDQLGNSVPTDNGVIVIDSSVKL